MDQKAYDTDLDITDRRPADRVVTQDSQVVQIGSREMLRAFMRKESRQVESARRKELNLLQDLERDEQVVTAFEYFFTRIKDGTFGVSSELERRLRVAGFDGQFAQDESGEDIRIGEDYLIVGNKEDRVVISEPDQKRLLIKLQEVAGNAEDDRRETEQTSRSLNYYAHRIVTGEITDRENLERSLRITNYDGQFAQDENGDIRIGENFLIVNREEDRVVVRDPEQKKLLVSLFQDTQAIQVGREQAEKDFAGFNFFTDRILSGRFNDTEVLQTRLQVASFDGRFAVDELGIDITDSSGQFFVVDDASERAIVRDPEQRRVLLDVGNILVSPRVSNEVKELFRGYLRSGDAADLTRLRTLIDAGESSVAKSIEDIATRYKAISERTTLRQRFYSNLFADDSVDTAIGTLTAYEQQNPEDTLLIAQLRDKAFAFRRGRKTVEFAEALAEPNRDFDTTLAIVDVLEKSPSAQDRTFGQVLRASLYKLELAIYRDEVVSRIALDVSPQDVYRYMDTLTIRPGIGDLDYVRAQSELKTTVGELFLGISKISRLKKANELRNGFSNQNVDEVLQRIADLDDETEEDLALKSELLDLYRAYTAANRPDIFDERFGEQMQGEMTARLRERFDRPELGKNKDAFRYIRENFVRSVFPLIETFRDDPRTKDDAEGLLTIQQRDGRVLNPRLQFIQRLTELERQRPLTDIERAYIESVELLTLFNPYLIAAARAEFGVTNEFLRHHFETVSHNIQEKLMDGEYVPLIQVGTGPNGLAALGEIVRNSPKLAEQVLVIDSGEQPGGPFAIPGGPAWELNSANRRGIGGYSMPDSPGRNELSTVRSYGSPVTRWYPGERPGGRTARQGSINTTVDYLPTPDDLSTARYPTNEELQTILALQTAMLTDNLALRTELIKVESNPNQDELGDKIATLRITDRKGEQREVRIKTDGVFVSSGLGEPTYGFKLEGSRAEGVILETKDSGGFPKITTTLEAFRELSNRTEEKKSPGRTIAIWGGGNSADTLIEFIGNIFQGDNPLVRDVTKIYVVSEGDLSSRPRYALISDLKPRNGRGNLIEQVYARVADVDFAGSSGPAEKREIVLLDINGRPIVDNSGRPISADSGIAATGFRSSLDNIFESYLDGLTLRDQGDNAPLLPIVLPTNPDVAVAEVFRADPNILLLGTASLPRFNSFEKLAQLPSEAREALLRNGAENAVAIGFRAPDTQAAVNVWLNSNTLNVGEPEQQVKPQVPINGDRPINTELSILRSTETEDLRIPNNVEDEELLLSPLLAYNIGTRFDLDSGYTGNVDFGVEYDDETGAFKIKFEGGDIQGISPEFMEAVTGSLSDEYFQRYALSLLRKRRRDPSLILNIAFKNGKINPRNTYAQTR